MLGQNMRFFGYDSSETLDNLLQKPLLAILSWKNGKFWYIRMLYMECS